MQDFKLTLIVDRVKQKIVQYKQIQSCQVLDFTCVFLVIGLLQLGQKRLERLVLGRRQILQHVFAKRKR